MPNLMLRIERAGERGLLQYGPKAMAPDGRNALISAASAGELPTVELLLQAGLDVSHRSKKGETAQTYNLVVADYHTYFVGKTGILSHDVLTPRGTNCLVPGLSRANAVARNK